MANEPTARRNPFADIAPALGEYTDKVLFSEVWERPGLSKRDRSLITVATLVALYRTNELPFHLKRALENGVTKNELIELMRIKSRKADRRRVVELSLWNNNSSNSTCGSALLTINART